MIFSMLMKEGQFKMDTIKCRQLFFPALLRHDWQITLYKFKVYNVTILYMYILRNGYYGKIN